MNQNPNQKELKTIQHQQEIQELKGTISLLTKQISEMKHLLNEICKTIVTDESKKKEFENALSNIEEQTATTEPIQLSKDVAVNNEKKENNIKENKKLEGKERPKKNEREYNINKKQCRRPISANSYTGPHKHFWSKTDQSEMNECDGEHIDE